MAKIPTLEQMLKAGMHFGHRTSKWHPKMAPYIYTSKGGVHIINLEISRKKLEEALNYLSKLSSENKLILFIGTKHQVKDKIKKLAQETSQPYVSEKWLAGLLTNFGVIKRMIKKYRDLKEKMLTGKLDKYTKKERLNFDRELKKLDEKVGGLVGMDRMPDAIFIWDIKKEETALAEAKKMKIPIIAICDTNVNPDGVKFVIPANDDASKTIDLVLDHVKQAILEGKNAKQENKS